MHKITIALISLGLLALAILGATVIVKTGPKAEKKQPPKTAALVKIQTLKATNETVVLQLSGTIIPAQEVLLRARVGGEIVATSPEFIEGGLLKKGAEILRIDPIDYELALATARSALETARFNHKLELGRQDVAKREWELLKSTDASEQERELALRIPHLAASRAALESAEAAFEKAKLNLARADIRAPFNAVVITRNANTGSQASLQDVLAKIAGTDIFRIIVSIPLDQVGWVTVPGSPASVVSNSGAIRKGRVIKLLADLEKKGRMARLLVEVEDPLCLKPENADKKPLLLGEYVRVDVEGRELKNVYSIPRKAIHDNINTWIADGDKLDIREVEVIWRDVQTAFVRDGLSDGEQLIISDLTTPVQGMDLNTGKEMKNSDSGMKNETEGIDQ